MRILYIYLITYLVRDQLHLVSNKSTGSLTGLLQLQTPVMQKEGLLNEGTPLSLEKPGWVHRRVCPLGTQEMSVNVHLSSHMPVCIRSILIILTVVDQVYLIQGEAWGKSGAWCSFLVLLFMFKIMPDHTAWHGSRICHRRTKSVMGDTAAKCGSFKLSNSLNCGLGVSFLDHFI